MSGQAFLTACESLALGALALGVALTLVRLVVGPTFADRIVALDLLTTLVVSLIGLSALASRVSLDLDIALALCLVGFVSTIALARYLLRRSRAGAAADPPAGDPGGERP